jgi:hypothetical protein
MIRTTFLAVAACVLLAAPAADARPGTRSFQSTYPHASRLCAKVANGHTPKALAASASKVSDACSTLKTSFTNAQNAYTTTAGPLQQQATDARKALRTTCQTSDRATCRQARRDTRATIRGLRAQVRDAARTYHGSVQNARKTFWDTIRALRGGATITPDKG